MSFLGIQALGVGYEVGLLLNPANHDMCTQQGSDLSADLINSCEYVALQGGLDLRKGIYPGEIHVCRGPGSFTSSRVSVLAAKLLAQLWNVPLKSATVMECVQKHYMDLPNLRIILSTGTPAYFVYDAEDRSSQVMLPEAIDFTKPWTSNITSLTQQGEFHPFPNILEQLFVVCAEKQEDKDVQPFYSIQPVYLKTETEVEWIKGRYV